jgi:hypothetical protein
LDKIYEERLSQKSSAVPVHSLMTDDQIKKGEYYRQQYDLRRSELAEYIEEWGALEDLYACNRTPDEQDPSYPNSFIPLITPVIEGQTASMIESDIAFNYTTSDPAHESAIKPLSSASKYNRRKNQFMRHGKDMARKYLLLGNSWFKVDWEENLHRRPSQPKGYGRVSCPELGSVFVDGRIKDAKDLQFAEYIIQEIGFVPIDWARRTYGDDYAESLRAGGRPTADDFDTSYDDMNSFVLLHVWTRNNEQQNLQLIEMDTSGLIFRESDPNKPYYEFVDNQYPFFMVRGNPQSGKFYGFGDGKILKPMQEVVNNLTDELELAARFSAQSTMFIDPNAGVDDESITSDPRKVVVATNPNQNIMKTQGGGINPVIQNMIEFLLREAERSTRFSSIMTGVQNSSSATATQINGQLSQGAIGIKDKKSDISAALEWADRYILQLCLEKWDAPFWVEIGDGKHDFIDMAGIKSMPSSVPTKDATIANAFLDAAETGEIPNIPEFELVDDAKGGTILSSLDFDVEVVMGAGIPRGKNDMYNIILGLMQIQTIGANGQPEPFLTTKRARKLMEDQLGLKLTEDEGEESALDQSQIMGGSPDQINPVSGSDQAQMPNIQSPENLFGTVPGTPNMDKRGYQ